MFVIVYYVWLFYTTMGENNQFFQE